MYNFQLDKNSVPIFYINKKVWSDKYKYVIHQCLCERMCYLLVEPDPNVAIRMVEITCLCRNDFTEHYELIEKYLGIKN